MQAVAYRELRADRIVAETNNGGEMVISTIKTIDPNVPVTAVTATRGKAIRAEPVAALYEQGRVHHVGMFRELEDQACDWNPADSYAKSPDRLDALVWGLTELMLNENVPQFLLYIQQQMAEAEAAKTSCENSPAIEQPRSTHDIDTRARWLGSRPS